MFEPLTDVLARVMSKRQVARTFTAAEICEAGGRILAVEAPQVGDAAKVVSLKNGVLWVAVRNSAVAAEVHGCAHQVLTQLKKRFTQVRSIRSTVKPEAFLG